MLLQKCFKDREIQVTTMQLFGLFFEIIGKMEDGLLAK